MATPKKAIAKKKPIAKSKPTSKKRLPKKQLLDDGGTYKSFKLGKNPSFFSVRVTKQTVYWSVLLLFILIMQLWILNTQLSVIHTLDILNAH